MHPRDNKLYTATVLLSPYSRETIHIVAKDLYDAFNEIVKHYPESSHRLKEILAINYVCNYVLISNEVKPEFEEA